LPSPILIGALSAKAYEERRNLCRETWVDDAVNLGVPVYFLVGNPTLQTSVPSGDTLYLPCRDDYRSLPSKTHAFCKWALEQPEWDYLLKCDDDSWIHIQRLLDYDMEDYDYAGTKWKPTVDYFSGAAYVLSRCAVELVVKHMTARAGAEDMLVGHQLRKHKVAMKDDPLHFMAFSSLDKRPKPDNQFIVAHVGGGQDNWNRLGRPLFEACHRDFH
jgi:hypothetical protein